MQTRDGFSHPVRDALERALTARIEACEAALLRLETNMGQKSNAKHDEASMKALAKQVEQLAEDVNELASWLYPPRPKMTLEQIVQARETLIPLCLSPNLMNEILVPLQRREVGPPRNKRALYVRAFELMLQPAPMSFGRVMSKLCECGKPHSASCRQRFQTGIRGVKVVLRKYAPEFVEQYDALHPDRGRLSSPPQPKVNKEIS